jgi:hypothetical protein
MLLKKICKVNKGNFGRKKSIKRDNCFVKLALIKKKEVVDQLYRFYKNLKTI